MPLARSQGLGLCREGMSVTHFHTTHTAMLSSPDYLPVITDERMSMCGTTKVSIFTQSTTYSLCARHCSRDEGHGSKQKK